MSEFVSLNDTVRFDVVVTHPISGFVINTDSTPRYYVFKDSSDSVVLQGDMTLRTGYTGLYRGSIDVTLANGFASGNYVNIKASGMVEGISAWGNIKEFVVEDIFNANVVKWSGIDQSRYVQYVAPDIYYSNIKYTRRNVSNNYYDYFAAQWYKNGSVVTSGQLTNPAISVFDTTTGGAIINNGIMSYGSTTIGSVWYQSQSPNVSVSGIPFLVSISGSIDGQTRAWNQIVGLDLLI